MKTLRTQREQQTVTDCGWGVCSRDQRDVQRTTTGCPAEVLSVGQLVSNPMNRTGSPRDNQTLSAASSHFQTLNLIHQDNQLCHQQIHVSKLLISYIRILKLCHQQIHISKPLISYIRTIKLCRQQVHISKLLISHIRTINKTLSSASSHLQTLNLTHQENQTLSSANSRFETLGLNKTLFETN